MLTRQLGKAGNLYYDFARGIDLRPVEPIRIRKSVGCEHTLEKDISLHSSAIIELYHVVTELLERLKRTNFSGNTLTLKIKFHDFNQITRSITQDSELTSMDKILPLAKKLLKEIDYESHPIRLIGLSVSNPKEEKEEIKKQWEQLSLEFKEWDDYESHPIRLIGLSVSNPKEEKEEIKKQWEQLSLEFKEWDD